MRAPVDIDDTDVIVRLYRDGGTTPIAQAPVHSLFWRQPVVAFEDNGLPVGAAHTYVADVKEANGANVSLRSTDERGRHDLDDRADLPASSLGRQSILLLAAA